MFKTRFGMTDLAGNFKNYMKFKLSSHLCKCKKETETEHHILSGQCKVYGHLRRKYKRNDDESMMKLFCEVLQERDEMDNQERAGVTATDSCPRAGGAANITEIELATASVVHPGCPLLLKKKYFIFIFFYYTSNQNAILSAHTENEIFRIKIEKVKNLFYPKSFNSPYPGGLRVEIFLPAKFP